MNKRRIFALVIIAACVQVFQFSDGMTTVKFFEYVHTLKTSFALAGFTLIGFIIGMLMK